VSIKEAGSQFKRAW